MPKPLRSRFCPTVTGKLYWREPLTPTAIRHAMEAFDSIHSLSPNVAILYVVSCRALVHVETICTESTNNLL